MRIPPLDVILSWPAPDREHPQTRGQALLVTVIIFTVLVVGAVGGRFYSRLRINKWFGLDDTFIALALIFTLGMNISVILANHRYGWNRHLWEVEVDMYQNAGIVAFCAKLLFVQAATFTRISLVMFYYRLVRDSGIQWFTWVLHGSMFFIVGLGISFTCVGIWLCSPIAAYWAFPPIPGSQCMDEGTATLTIGVFNCVADLLTTLLPIPLIMRLQMPLRHRIGVCVLLGLGFIVTIAGVTRTYFIWKSLVDSWDVTWYSYPLWICAAIEIDLAVICACAPALKPLVHQPILRITSRISSKLSSVLLRSRGTNSSSQTSSDDRNNSAKTADRTAFRFVQGHEDDEEKEHGVGVDVMQQPSHHSDRSAIQGAYIPVDAAAAEKQEEEEQEEKEEEGNCGNSSNPPRSARRSGAQRPPPLQILKRQSLDQEISYLDPEVALSRPKRCETFDL